MSYGPQRSPTGVTARSRAPGVSEAAPRSDGDGEADSGRPDEGVALDGVAAHRLLGSSSVVCMGLTTLLRLWKRLPDEQCLGLLERMVEHAAAVDDGLKLLTLGHDGVAVLPTRWPTT